MNDVKPRPLTDLEQEIYAYVTSCPGVNAEQVMIQFAGYEQDAGSTEKRREVARAIGYLIHNAYYIKWNTDTGELTAMEIPS